MYELMFTFISQIRLWTHRQKGHISYHFVVSSQCEAHTARYSVDTLSAPAWSESSHSLSSLYILDWLVIMVPRKPMYQILTEFEMWHFIRKGFQSFYISGTTPFGCLCLPYHLCSAEEAAGHGHSLILFVDMGFT